MSRDAIPAGESRPLLRILRSREGIAVSIGVAIGAGILRTPGDVAGILGSPSAVLAVWLVGGVLVLLDALVLAELAARRPHAGGHYVYLREAYGPRVAFVFGWSAAFLTWPASVAALAGVGQEYAARLGLNGTLVGFTIILGPTLLHATGLRTSAVGQDLLSYGKLLALGLLALAAFLAGPSTVPADPIAAEPPASAAGVFAFAGAFVLALQRVLWTYDGYADTVFVAEETREPGRSLPRALVTSSLLLVGIYLALNQAFLHRLGVGGMAHSNLVAADLAGSIAGAGAVHVVEALALLTVLAAASATLLSGPRISFAMARDGLLFPAFCRVSRQGSPQTGLFVMAALALVYWRLQSFDRILEMTIFVIWVFVTLTTISLFLFRRRDAAVLRPFAIPLYPLPPLVLLGSALVFLVVSLGQAPRSALEGLAVMAAGLVAYEIWSRLRK